MSHASDLADRSLHCLPVSCCGLGKRNEPPTGLTLTNINSFFFPPGARLEFDTVVTNKGSLNPVSNSVIAEEAGLYLISYSASVVGPPLAPIPNPLRIVLRVNALAIGAQTADSPAEISDSVVVSLKAGDVVDLINSGSTALAYLPGTTPHLTIVRPA